MTREQVEQWFSTFDRHPDYQTGFDELWDLTEVEHIDMPTGTIRAVASKEAKTRALHEPARAAIVVTTPLLVGLARMYQTYSEIEGTNLEIELFDTLDAARQWIGLPDEFVFDELPEGLKF